MRDADTLQFVDTNILIYGHDQSAGAKHERAKQLLTELWQNRTGCVSVQVLQEFYVNITQKVPKPLSSEIAAQIISDLAVWQVHQPGVSDVLHAIHLQSHHQISFWDAMVLASAIALKCEILWSKDLNPRQRYDTVTVANPFV